MSEEARVGGGTELKHALSADSVAAIKVLQQFEIKTQALFDAYRLGTPEALLTDEGMRHLANLPSYKVGTGYACCIWTIARCPSQQAHWSPLFRCRISQNLVSTSRMRVCP